MDILGTNPESKAFEMSDFYTNRSWEDRRISLDLVGDDIDLDQDVLMEQILENINTTPIGRVLKKISMLPDVRREKVLDLRRQLTEGNYNLTDRLDVALDRVLEEFTA
jgi:negative regulator of flagellin synthesis FlgM